MTLDEIRVLLRFKDAPHENCAQVNDLLDEHIDRGYSHQGIESAGTNQDLAGKLPESQQASQCGILTDAGEHDAAR